MNQLKLRLLAVLAFSATCLQAQQIDCSTCMNPCDACVVQFSHPLVCPGVNDSVLASGCVDDFPDVNEGVYITRCYSFVPQYDSLLFSMWMEYSGGNCSTGGACDQICSCSYSFSYDIYRAGVCSPLWTYYKNGYPHGWNVGDPLVICYTWLPRCRHRWSIPLAWTEEGFQLLPIETNRSFYQEPPSEPEEQKYVDFNISGQIVGPNYTGFIIRSFEDGTHVKLMRHISDEPALVSY